MDAMLINLLASVSACNARVEGMKVANVLHPQPVYTEADFAREAGTLEHIADAARKYANY